MSDLDALTREELIALAKQLYTHVTQLEAELARLRKDPPSGAARAVPAFVKADRVAKEKKERKKRSRSYVRRREEPTEVVVHAVDACPDCGRRLSGGHLHRSRQVIEIPEMPVRVIEHRMMARWCGVCRKRHIASPDLSREVVGSHRLGVRLMSLIGCMKTVQRMPVRTIQRSLRAVYGLDISIGEIVEVGHAVAQAGEPLYAQLREAVRQSSYVHADETGWREDGENGYLWSFSAPGIRYFHRDASRGHQVPESVLGEAYAGILVSDFYGGYNYHLGLHQRCWVHFLRDLHDLKKAAAQEQAVVAWVGEVVKVYEEARAFESPRREARVKARERFQERLLELGDPDACTHARQSVLAERCLRFANELFTFVEHPWVPSENNAAERALRPSVIDRKISGGTRAPKGSRTRSVLMSLFRTWEAQGLDVLDACRRMLAHELAPT
jgi:transposase